MQENIVVYAKTLEADDAVFGSDHTRTVLKGLIETIVAHVRSCAGSQILHVKGFCTGHEDDYLKVNFVSHRGGVNVSGAWRHHPARIRLTLNVIAMGISFQPLEGKIASAIAHQAQRFVVPADHGDAGHRPLPPFTAAHEKNDSERSSLKERRCLSSQKE